MGTDFNEEKEILILIDEDGNEIILDEDYNGSYSEAPMAKENADTALFEEEMDPGFSVDKDLAETDINASEENEPEDALDLDATQVIPNVKASNNEPDYTKEITFDEEIIPEVKKEPKKASKLDFLYEEEDGRKSKTSKKANSKDDDSKSNNLNDKNSKQDDLENIESLYDDDEAEFDEEESILSGAANKLMIALAALIAVIAICVGIFFITGKTAQDEEVDFSKVGITFQEIGVVGEANIKAITTARVARLQQVEEAQETFEYEEVDVVTGVIPVNITLTTILKDIKIKFTNSKGKLIANVPFEVEVTTPSGTTTTWTDTDKDGIIYQSDIAGGSYSVKLVALNDYASMYDFTQKTLQSIAVKTQLDYQKVDVTNEIKDSTQVAASEDAASNPVAETTEPAQPTATDTVEFVASGKTENPSGGYKAVDKSSINDPMVTLANVNETASLDGAIIPVTTENASSVIANPVYTGNFEGDSEAPVTDEDFEETSTVPEHEHTLDKIVSKKNGTHYYKCTFDGCNYKEKESCNYAYTKSGSDSDQTHTKLCVICGYEVTENCSKTEGNACECGYEFPNVEVSAELKISGTKLYSVSGEGKDGELKAKLTVTPDTVEIASIEWSVTEGSDVVELANINKKTVSVSAKKTGTAKIRCTVTLNDSNSTVVKKSVEVTVSNGVEISVDVKNTKNTKTLFLGTDATVITATTEGGAKNTVEWSIEDSSIANISVEESADETKGTSKCTVSPIKAGKTTLKVKSKENSEIAKTITLIVYDHPKNDTSTKLLDKDGNQVYVYLADSKEYREAVYADYYSGVDLYNCSGPAYFYTGWQTIDGKTYYYDKNGTKVTGNQVIQGVEYSFDSDGVMRTGTGTFGIDVSKWNGTIDWNKVAASGVSYAIIRCGFRGTTLGGLVEDSNFKSNIQGATNAGIKVGVYFFSQAVTESEAVEEASMCLSLVKDYKLSYPIFLDSELAANGRANNLSKEERTKIIKAFCKTITNAGYKAGVYASKNWFAEKINSSDLSGYKLWMAYYTSPSSYTPTGYDLWQYTEKGNVDGIDGGVDLNLSYMGY